MHVPNRRFTKLFRIPENKERLISLFHEGKSDKEICDIFHCDHTSIRRHRILMGFPPTRRSNRKCITKQNAPEIVEMIAAGKDDWTISMRFGIKKENIRQFRRRRYQINREREVRTYKSYQDYLQEAKKRTPEKYKWIYSLRHRHIRHECHDTIVI